ncbi:MAG TPA: c-type cytochrome domain-containing protein [Puia sp.]|nr:c-type cytochrome domain-containing protein [Puia sp.]
MSYVLTLIGRLHPLLVHLPIGILLLAIFLEALSVRGPYAELKRAADLSLLIGVCSAVLSCCTGWLLAQSGDYDPSLVKTHQWLAISLTVVSGALYGVVRQRPVSRWRGALLTGVLLLLILTGHWGGSLTHGPGFLTADPESAAIQPTLQPVADIPSAVVYTTMVEPVLHDNCYGCHSVSRVKGGLRLDAPDRILRGGKDGKVIVAGNAGKSLLVKRIELPVDDDHHMAPKDKGQLTTAETRLLRWWIDHGAPFDKSVGQLPQDTGMAAVWQAFHTGSAGPTAAAAVMNVADSDLPMGPAPQAPAEAVRRLQSAGELVLPIAQGSNYLELDCMSDTLSPEALKAVPLLKDQLVIIKFSRVRAGDELVTAAAACPRLVRLWLDHTAITGANLGELTSLSNLKYLNLTATKVRAADVARLKGAQKLTSLYLYQTRIGRGDWAALRQDFPAAKLDSGAYTIPFLTTDTAIVRTPARPHP